MIYNKRQGTGIEKREEVYWESKEEFDWLTEEYIHKIINQIPQPRGNSLELCSGDGMFTKRMDFSDSKKYICLDISQRLLDKLKSQLKSIEIKKEDVQKMSFKNNSFDNIFVFAGLHHLPNLDLTIQKSHDILRSGGKFICFEPNNRCFYRTNFILSKFKNLLNRYTALYTEDEIFLNPDEVVKKLSNAGFTNIQVKYFTPTFKLSHIKGLYPVFILMKILAIIPSKYFRSFFLITANKRS